MENQNKIETQTNQTKPNYFSNVCLILAIVAFLMSFIAPPILFVVGPYVLGILAILSIISGIIGIIKSKELNKGKAIAIVGIILAILSHWYLVVIIAGELS